MLIPKISVIVPVYNTAKYLHRCLDSILQQSFKDFEVLLVDDGSTDKSLSICSSFASNDDRIKVFHQENKGVTAARKIGLEHSRGEFICFVDSDDIIEKSALSVLISKMTDDVDVVITWESVEQIISGKEYVNRLLLKSTTLALWGKLYRKEIIVASGALDIRREIFIGEDHLANIKIALMARNIVCLSAAIYVYCDNLQSVWRTRKCSLEYEEMFRNEIELALGNRIGEFEESWYRFQLYVLYDLIMHKVKFSYKKDWIAQLVKDNHNYQLSMRERLVKSIHHQFLCRSMLILGSKLKHKFLQK